MILLGTNILDVHLSLLNYNDFVLGFVVEE